MAQVSTQRPTIRNRVVDKVVRAVVGDLLDDLEQRLRDLEAEVQECRQLNLRLAEVTDLLEQVLLPAGAQDPERLAAALEKYSDSL
jgi:hypothetical protein